MGETIYPLSCPLCARQLLSSRYGNAICLNVVCGWLQECLAEHGLCRAVVPPLPSRILFLGSSTGSYSREQNLDQGGWLNDDLRLIERCGQHIAGHYFCLSYCWGDGYSIRKTTTDNKARNLNSIVFSELLPLFRDAVIYTRKFGFQYMWIDSLCIIQDDDADWQAESTRMTEIFQNSVLILASRDSTSPILHACARSYVTQTRLHSLIVPMEWTTQSISAIEPRPTFITLLPLEAH